MKSVHSQENLARMQNATAGNTEAERKIEGTYNCYEGFH